MNSYLKQKLPVERKKMRKTGKKQAYLLADVTAQNGDLLFTFRLDESPLSTWDKSLRFSSCVLANAFRQMDKSSFIRALVVVKPSILACMLLTVELQFEKKYYMIYGL